ncbi:MAG TPA: FIST N-terminal domain-containing protein, partial [Holophaga sp.]|nr:FIST N-terminal domain-containing protein [Holophaga sp.]
MEIWQTRSKGGLASVAWDRLGGLKPDLVLAFGSIDHFLRPGFPETLREVFPDSLLLGCSTAGEITREGVLDGHVVLTAIKFGHPCFRSATSPLHSMDDSRQAGGRLGEALAPPHGALPLKGVLLLGLGVRINGSALIRGLAGSVGPEVAICGALAGDGGAFARTFTLCDGRISDREIVALGLYGDGIEISTASAGGWMPFGAVRRITRAKDNVLYELDGEPALSIYRRYLGEWAKDLPGSGLL